MSDNDGRSLTKKVQLSRLEHNLQRHIQETTEILSAAFTLTSDTKQSLTTAANEMRHKMAKLRQWRNGTDRYTSRHLERFVLDTIRLRLETARVRIVVLQDTLSRIDAILTTLRHCPRDVIHQRDVIGSELASLEQRIDDSVDVAGEEWMMTSESRLASLENDVLRLRIRVKELTSATRNKKSKMASCETNSRLRFEHHPEVNRVLRNAGRIRKLMKLLSDGGHMDIASKPDCLENDLEVLHRQLNRIQLWQNEETSFNKSNVDDLEIIFAAIASHLRPELDLDQSTASRSSISRSSSSNSDHSPESGYPCPSPYVGSTISRIGSFSQSEIDVVIGPEDDNTDIVDERLI